MLDLGGLIEPSNSSKPTVLEFVYYLFFKRGTGLEEFNRLPIPYIMSVVKTYNYIKKQEDKEYKKLNKKK